MKGTTMATIIERTRVFLRSPQGQRLARQAREQLNKPDNQRRLRQLAQRLRRRDMR
jgi:cytidylate kinase